MNRIIEIIYPIRIICWISILLLFTSCSKVYKFFIVNQTSAPLKIDVKLEKDRESSSIFFYPDTTRDVFSFYEMQSSKSVDFGTKTNCKVDTMNHFSHYRVTIPPNKAFQYGRLSNQRYERYDQEFINGQTFNLNQIHFSVGHPDIRPENFDHYITTNQSGILMVINN